MVKFIIFENVDWRISNGFWLFICCFSCVIRHWPPHPPPPHTCIEFKAPQSYTLCPPKVTCHRLVHPYNVNIATEDRTVRKSARVKRWTDRLIIYRKRKGRGPSQEEVDMCYRSIESKPGPNGFVPAVFLYFETNRTRPHVVFHFGVRASYIYIPQKLVQKVTAF